jgi:chromosome partitioning protein
MTDPTPDAPVTVAPRPADRPADESAETPAESPATGGGRIIAVANQKGGVGKTTTAINLATALAAVGRRVLVVDLDPQGNASTGLGIESARRTAGTYDLLLGEITLDQALVGTAVPGLAVIPSTMDLSAAELELVDMERRQDLLRDALRSATTRFDYVLIDCPPALGLLTLNGLVAADTVLVPLQCEFLALEGLSQLVRTIDRVTSTFNPGLQLEGIVLTMYDSRNKLSSLVSDDVRSYFRDKVYDTVIPRNVRVSEAPSHGKPVLLYDLACTGSQAYIHLAREVLQRNARRVENDNATEPGGLVPDSLRAPETSAADTAQTPQPDAVPEAAPQTAPQTAPETAPKAVSADESEDPTGDAS